MYIALVLQVRVHLPAITPKLLDPPLVCSFGRRCTLLCGIIRPVSGCPSRPALYCCTMWRATKASECIEPSWCCGNGVCVLGLYMFGPACVRVPHTGEDHPAVCVGATLACIIPSSSRLRHTHSSSHPRPIHPPRAPSSPTLPVACLYFLSPLPTSVPPAPQA
jgi:hypothetical protein